MVTATASIYCSKCRSLAEAWSSAPAEAKLEVPLPDGGEIRRVFLSCGHETLVVSMAGALPD